jgi:hypothetical protein
MFVKTSYKYQKPKVPLAASSNALENPLTKLSISHISGSALLTGIYVMFVKTRL